MNKIFIEPLDDLQLGDKVVCPTEHPNSIGEVMRLMPNGYSIQWVMPPSEKLPFGCINNEFWPKDDAVNLLYKLSQSEESE